MNLINKIYCITLSILLSSNLSLNSAATIQYEEASVSPNVQLMRLLDRAKYYNVTGQEIQKVIDAGADINALDEDGNRPLIRAISSRSEIDERIVKLLIKAGANVNFINVAGDTALITAIYYKKKNIAKLLIESGADVNGVDNIGEPTLQISVALGDLDICQLLISYGADIDANDHRTGQTALMMAAAFNTPNKPMVEFLLNSGANIDKVDNQGINATDHARRLSSYHYLCQTKEMKKNSENVVKLLEAEPARRKAAKENREQIADYLKNLKSLPPVLTSIINDYLPSDLRNMLTDYEAVLKVVVDSDSIDKLPDSAENNAILSALSILGDNCTLIDNTKKSSGTTESENVSNESSSSTTRPQESKKRKTSGSSESDDGSAKKAKLSKAEINQRIANLYAKRNRITLEGIDEELDSQIAEIQKIDEEIMRLDNMLKEI